MRAPRFIAVLIVIGVFGLTGCVGSEEPAKPKATHTPAKVSEGPAARTERFERALIKGDCAAVKKIILGQMTCAELNEISQSLQGVNPDKITYKVVESGKDSATVRITVSGERQNLDLVKDEGEWFVIYDTAA